jgi:hypothetical protein
VKNAGKCVRYGLKQQDLGAFGELLTLNKLSHKQEPKQIISARCGVD